MRCICRADHRGVIIEMSNIWMVVLFFSFGAFFTVSPAEARGPLGGWGPLKFTMSREEARSVIGSNYNETPSGNIKFPTSINEIEFVVYVQFSRNSKRIERISIEMKGASNFEQAECLSRMDVLTDLVTDRYGPPDMIKIPSQITPGISIDSNIHYITTYLFSYGASIQVTSLMPRGDFVPFKCSLAVNYSAPPPQTKKEQF